MSDDRIVRVPAGTRVSTCTGHAMGGSCQAPIYWVRVYDPKRRDLRPIPVDCSLPGMQRPSEASDDSQRDLFAGKVEIREGLGVSHFTNCPDRALIAQTWAQRHERQTA